MLVYSFEKVELKAKKINHFYMRKSNTHVDVGGLA